MNTNQVHQYALAAQPQLSGLVFAIVGTLEGPLGLRVWIDDGQALLLAEAVQGEAQLKR